MRRGERRTERRFANDSMALEYIADRLDAIQEGLFEVIRPQDAKIENQDWWRKCLDDEFASRLIRYTYWAGPAEDVLYSWMNRRFVISFPYKIWDDDLDAYYPTTRATITSNVGWHPLVYPKKGSAHRKRWDRWVNEAGRWKKKNIPYLYRKKLSPSSKKASKETPCPTTP